MTVIRLCQFFDYTSAGKTASYRLQNYFIGQNKNFNGRGYTFAPFQADGAMASLNGENQQFRVLFPAEEIIVRMVEASDGNRLSTLELTTAWVTASDQLVPGFSDYYIGIGASYSDETVELRFRSAMDSVGASFPARTLSVDNVGILPLNAELYLQ